MHTLFVSFVIYSYVSLYGVFGGDPPPAQLPGPCPDPPKVTNFDVAKFSGVWYDVLHTSRRTALRIDCDQIKFTALNATTLKFNSFTYNVMGERIINVLGTAEVIKNSGNFYVKIPTLSKKGNIRVIHNDYSTIAVLFACKDLGNNIHEQSSVVLTREKHPGVEIMSLANNILLIHRLSVVNLKKTLQLNCKKYDFDSLIELNSYEGDNTSLAPLFFTKPSPGLIDNNQGGGHH